MKKATMAMMLIVFMTFGISGFAQKTNLRIIMKDGTTSYEKSISEIDKVVFQDPLGITIAPPSDYALTTLKKDDSSPLKIRIDSIAGIEFSETEMTIVPFSGDSNVIALENIDKLLLNDLMAGINSLKAQSGIKVIITAEGEMIVESKVVIQSLTVMNITGAVVNCEHFPSLGVTFGRINIQSFPAGVYIICVKTFDGTIVKKITI